MDTCPDSKVHEANTGPICGRQDPGGFHVDPMNFAIWDDMIANSYVIVADIPVQNMQQFIQSSTGIYNSIIIHGS